MEPNEKIFTLAENFSASAKILTAIGDETRQHLILEMMKMGNCMGVRVDDITKKTNLSRPAVSHHLQIMKDAGIVKVRKEGTKNYYYLSVDETVWNDIADLVNGIYESIQHISSQS